ncbi:ab-hydrolase associated lipase [Purpureocillium lavendulum]|uniref:Ab-hydrolase associated lipase n=1 Tax=Purpureocillium lavendulum TaxID=1247861 RepID=A0AB34FZK8_9HYPO|nr:ab-hydrolase associated lipase [Purpureocillium lavendulum]
MGASSTGGQRASGSSTQVEVAQHAVDFAHQAEKLSLRQPTGEEPSVAIKAEFVTPQDPVIVESDGSRLPGVPLHEAHRLNVLREELEGPPETVEIKQGEETKEKISNANTNGGGKHKVIHMPDGQNSQLPQPSAGGTLKRSMPPSHTNPLFPPLPLYGPPSLMRNIQCLFFRVSSFFLSLTFLSVIVLGAVITSIPHATKKLFYRLTLRKIDEKRPFYDEEKRRAELRKKKQEAWGRRPSVDGLHGDQESAADDYPPTEGGKDPIVCDVGYYARRVGLDAEEFRVQTEDGFIIDLIHVFDPREYTKLDETSRDHMGPTIFQGSRKKLKDPGRKPKFPVLLMHGLLQSSGAYCCNDDESLAFWLCKSGFDVWLGNNRCGFKPRHTVLEYGDPRMWCWNIRQMGVFDLPALTSRVLAETGLEKLGLICHSQGTTETFVALAKEQRPDLGEKLTVFCALAPAAYAGPLIGKMYFKFMRLISPAMFRMVFGIHAFMPIMMQMHRLLPPRFFGWMGYKVFSYLFNWTDTRWDRGLRDRMFQFAPVYVSAESMRWWLGRECFAKQKCILATKETTREEEAMDAAAADAQPAGELPDSQLSAESQATNGSTAWYNEQVPPFALWVCGNDALVDGRRLLKRFGNGREPHVKVVHSKVVDEYEHLDVLWAIDAPDQIFTEIREVLWKTCHARETCRVPLGCEAVGPWQPDASAGGEPSFSKEA